MSASDLMFIVACSFAGVLVGNVLVLVSIKMGWLDRLSRWLDKRGM